MLNCVYYTIRQNKIEVYRMAGRKYLNGKNDGELAVRSTTTLPQACIDYVDKYGKGGSFSARLRWIVYEHCWQNGKATKVEVEELTAIVSDALDGMLIN